MTRPTRVALVTQGYFTAGGVQAVSRWLRQALESAGHVVDVHELATSATDPASRLLTRPRTWLRPSLREEVGPEGVVHWGAHAPELEVMRYRARRELTRALATYDIVQVVAGGSALALAAAACGRPVVLQVATRVRWEREARQSYSRGPLRWPRHVMTQAVSGLEGRALRSVARVMVENAVMADYVRSIGQPAVELAPPGVDTEMFSPRPEGWSRSGYLVSVCRLADPRKRLALMVRAYAALRRAHPDAPPLVLAGRGEPDQETVETIDRLGLRDHVDVRSDLSPAGLVELYQGASIFWQTSLEEGLGISSIEAQACGLPVVSSRSAGASKAVSDGVSGHLVELEEDALIEQLVEHTASLLAGPEGESMSRGARAWAIECYSTAAAVAPYLEAYSRLLAHD